MSGHIFNENTDVCVNCGRTAEHIQRSDLTGCIGRRVAAVDPASLPEGAETRVLYFHRVTEDGTVQIRSVPPGQDRPPGEWTEGPAPPQVVYGERPRHPQGRSVMIPEPLPGERWPEYSDRRRRLFLDETLGVRRAVPLSVPRPLREVFEKHKILEGGAMPYNGGVAFISNLSFPTRRSLAVTFSWRDTLADPPVVRDIWDRPDLWAKMLSVFLGKEEKVFPRIDDAEKEMLAAEVKRQDARLHVARQDAERQADLAEERLQEILRLKARLLAYEPPDDL